MRDIAIVSIARTPVGKAIKGGFRDILQAAPFFNVFAVLARN